MTTTSLYLLLADAVLALHVAFVAFVVGGLLLIIVGNRRRWGWVNAPWFRLAHLAAIGIVVAQVWLGIICPLTTLEIWLRQKAGAPTYGGTFIAHWLQKLLYLDLPWWVFIVAYSLFGLLVAATWVCYPPRLRRRKEK